MTRATVSPVQRFLGESEARGGALALLGLDVSSVDERSVLRALNVQLARVSSHAERDTPAADEVRLALHAAAAQLLDPAVRAIVIARARGQRTPETIAPRPARLASPKDEPVSHGAVRAFEHDALRLLARHGGWGAGSMRQLAQFAHARGMPAEQLVERLHAMLRGGGAQNIFDNGGVSTASPPAGTGDAPSGRSALSTAPRQESPVLASVRSEAAMDVRTARTVRLAAFLLIGLIGVLLLAYAGVMVTRTPAPGGGGAANPPVASAGSGAAIATDAAAPAGPEPGRDRSLQDAVVRTREGGVSASENARERRQPEAVDMARLVRDIRATVAMLDDDPGQATDRFTLLVRALSRGWTTLAPVERAAAHDAVVEFLYRAGEHPHAVAGATRAVASPAAVYAASSEAPAAGEVPAVVWSVGMLARLSRERDLPARARSEIEATLAGALGERGLTGDRVFDDAAHDALRSVALRLATGGGSARAWEAWTAVAGALAGDGRDRRVTLLLRGLDTLLDRGPSPSESEDVFAAIGVLVRTLPWRDSDATRPWLVGRFDAPRITIAHLHAITTALATQSSADGVDLTMVVRRRDSESERRAMRDRYATAWGIETPAGGGAWAEAWRTLLRRAPVEGERGAPAWLRSAVAISMLNESAALAWGGDSDGADAALGEARAFLERRGTFQRRGAEFRGIQNAPADGWWARYLNAGSNVPARMDLLRDLAHRGPAGVYRQDATVLVREALRGVPAQVRETAMQTLRRLSMSPAVVNAMLDELHRLPDSRGARELVASVAIASATPREGEAWHQHARRSLVIRLLELTASAGELAEVDDLADALALSYARRAGDPRASESGAVNAADSAAALRVALERQASRLTPGGRVPITLGEIERRRASRAGLAHGPVQRFCVEQLAVCELLAYIVALERPAEAGRVGAILDRLERERREADHVFIQIGAVEQAVAMLWRLRFGEVEG